MTTADAGLRIDLGPAGPRPPSGGRPRPAAPARRDGGTPASGRPEGGGADAAASARSRSRSRPRERRSLHGPVVDFLLLGGGSFLVLGAMAAFFPRDEAARAALAGAMLLLAHFVNHPHFAHSYQIFYRGFMRKAFPPPPPAGPAPTGTAPTGTAPRRADATPAEPDVTRPGAGAPLPAASSLAARYRFAGLLVPAVLAAFFAAALAAGSVALLGLAANVMFFMVGWHYAKQGYGILMLDAARKGLRFAPDARRRLLWNTHLAWIASWLAVNDLLAAKELWGITWYLFDVPDPLLHAMAALVAVSALAVGRDLLTLWRAERALPVNGLLAWVAAVYVWLAVGRLDPVLLLVVPFFHSLQYLAVVWRYQLGVEEADRLAPEDTAPADHAARPDRQGGPGPAGDGAPLPRGEGLGAREEHVPAFRVESSPASVPLPREPETAPPAEAVFGWKAWLRSAPAGLARFILAGGALGFAGFWAAPVMIDALSGYDRAVFGATLFLFIGWTFINIHHYFIDNVIWRRENPETRRHLFGGGAR